LPTLSSYYAFFIHAQD